MHTNSSYPSKTDELNLSVYRMVEKINGLGEKLGTVVEYGLVTTFMAVTLGSTWVERHVTLDRNMWGLIKNHLFNLKV